MLHLTRERLEVIVSAYARYRAKLEVYYFARERDVPFEHPGESPRYISGASELLAMAYRKDWYVVNDARLGEFTEGWFIVERNTLYAQLRSL